jgi:two-component system NtrC family sensor kinase
MRSGKKKKEKRVRMGNPAESSGESTYEPASSRERTLLRKVADNYYGICVVRLIEGIVHNLNGPLQILYIRSEQLEQSLDQLRGALQSEALTEVDGLAGRMEERVKSISGSLDDLNGQLGHLTSDLVVERCSEIGDVKINQVIQDCLFLLNALKGRKMDFCVIVLNLIQNALEAMVDTQDKDLTVETFSQGDEVIIRVQDTGCGIPEGNRQHIYKVFFTTKKGTAYEAKCDEHAGLGLSLVSLLLEDYSGTIACESIPGKTTFTVQLPFKVK